MGVTLLQTIEETRRAVTERRRARATIGLAPTMGALHAGHAALVECARRGSDFVVVTIFVNPTQFNRPDDYRRYPRTLERDLDFCERLGVDLVFAPSEEEMYPRAPYTSVEVSRVSEHLCGAFRPGHFRGVATVVAKLFNIVPADHAYFGEKDAQQLALIRRLAADLNFPIRIVAVPTVREADGLALSSRHALLTPEERRAAPVLYRALREAARLIDAGEARAAAAREAALAVLGREPLARVEYLDVVDPEEMQPVEQITGPVRVAGAAWLGPTRLIDNLLCAPPSSARD